MPFKPEIISISSDEEFKTISTAVDVIDQLIARWHDRGSAIVALSGGLVGDVAGFVASCYMRGVSLIQVPTRLLAQVDSAVGGKNGLNLPVGRNLIGSFYNPNFVVADIDTLSSLSDRIYLEGLAEVIKYGVAADAGFFEWLETHRDLLINRNPVPLRHAIYTWCRITPSIMQEDENEHGIRALLNFGHTIGQAIKQLAGFGVLLHGEAVAIGMSMATDLSHKFESCTCEVSNRIPRLLSRHGLPTTLSDVPYVTPKQLLHTMAIDKKAIGGKIHSMMAHGVGKADVFTGISSELVESAIRPVI